MATTLTQERDRAKGMVGFTTHASTLVLSVAKLLHCHKELEHYVLGAYKTRTGTKARQ